MRRLCLFSSGFAAAVAAAVWLLPQTLLWPFAGALAAAAIGGALLRRDAAVRAALLCAGAACALLWTGLYGSLLLSPAEALDGTEQEISCMVLRFPRTTDYGAAVTVSISTNGRKIGAMLYLDESARALTPGDELTCTASLRKADSFSSGEETFYYLSTGVHLLGTADSYTVTKTGDAPISVWPAILCGWLGEQVRSLFPDDVQALLLALITGDRSGLSFDVRNALSIVGVYHAVAVSGMHLGILVGMLQLLIRRRRRAALVGIPTILFFIAMMNGTPSVVRAGVMQILLLSAPLFRRENDSLTSLALAGLVLLGSNPYSICNVGLQLSFASTAGIVLFSGKLNGYFTRALEPIRVPGKCPRLKKLGGRAKRFLASGLSTTLGALILSQPLMAVDFGVISLIAPLSNLLLLWAVTVCFAVGMPVCLLGALVPAVGRAAAWVAAWPARYFLWLGGALARVPFAAVYTESFYLCVWLAFVYGLALIVWIARGRLRPALPLSAGVLTLCVSLLLSAVQNRAANMSVTALDVGQGQCILLEAGETGVMVDCGGDDAQSGEDAARRLLSEGRFSLDALILTHFDTDHVDGVEQLFRRIRVGRIYLPDETDDAGNRDTLLAAAALAGVPVDWVRSDTTLNFTGGMLQIFAPEADADATDNEAGLCVLFSAADYDTLITGDMGMEGEQRLLLNHTLPDLELLVAGHHGSKYATGKILLAATRPETVLISVGYNTYGQPADETLDRLADAGATVYRTDQCGTITIRR